MKSVLVIDAPPMLREFLKEKLSAEKITVEIADGQRDALPKFLSLLPDLVILNISNSVSEMMDFLEKKQADPNGKKIPVIMTGPAIDNEDIADLVQFGVIKYFTRPINFDLFFDSIGRVLHTGFSVDSTPCVLDMHLNKNIIFIEIAMGLNREKITLLKYRLSELIDNNDIASPKIILMMSDLSLSYVDGLNLELLLSNITSDRRIVRRNIKILSFDEFVADFIEGHPIYEGIQVVQSLSQVIDSLGVSAASESVEQLISDKILSSTETEDDDIMAARFFSASSASQSGEDTSASQLKIAIIDNDITVISYLKRVVETLGEVFVFGSGKEFLEAVKTTNFDAAITGLYIPEISGLDILKFLVDSKINLPVLIYSSVVQKEVIMQTLKLGASSYLIKPQPPEVIIQKLLEVINAKKQA